MKRVQVVKCEQESYWYNDAVGKSYNVVPHLRDTSDPMLEAYTEYYGHKNYQVVVSDNSKSCGYRRLPLLLCVSDCIDTCEMVNYNTFKHSINV